MFPGKGERKTRGISQWEPSHRTCRVPLIFPAGGSSGCRLETLVVDRRGERDRIDRSTTFEGSLYSSFPDLRTQAWCRVALERGGVGSNTEWATGVGGRGGDIRARESHDPLSSILFPPCHATTTMTADLSFLSRLVGGENLATSYRPRHAPPPLVVRPAFSNRSRDDG